MALVYYPGSSRSVRSISPLPTLRASSTHGGPSSYPPPFLDSSPALFDHAWGRVRQHVGGAPFGAGVGLHEAKRWHRRAYGRSPGEIDRMSPTEIGHAAAYEAFRQWLHDTPSYDPMDSERQRSSLIALAVAESSRLLQYLPYKATDGYSRTVASESAAFTASTLFYESRDDGYRSRGYDRDAWSSSDEYYDDDYRRSRSHSRPRHSRSLSRHRSAYLPPAQPQILPVGATSYMGSSVHVPGITPAAYPTPGMHPYGHGTAYGTHGTYIPPPSAIYPSAPLGSSHAYPGSSAPIVVSAGASMHHPQYAQTVYPGTTTGHGGQVIVLPPQRRHKHHRHHKRSRSRSSSSERAYMTYAPSGIRY